MLEMDVVLGKTIQTVVYLHHELVMFQFTDGTTLQIKQTSQTGTLRLFFDGQSIVADDEEI
jgi:hypothetical protein